MTKLRLRRAGFTLIEILVALVVLSVGLLGMAAMTIMVMRGNSMAVKQTNATNLAQQLIERLKDVDFDLLGTDSPCPATNIETLGNGRMSHACRLGNLNALGRQGPATPTNPGPFIYDVYLTICDSTSTYPRPPAALSSVDRCANVNTTNTNLQTNLPPELTCADATGAGNNLSAGEVRIRVMVSWLDTSKVTGSGNPQERGCRSVDLYTMVTD